MRDFPNTDAWLTNLATGSEYMNDNLYFIEKRVGFISHFILQLLNNLLGWSA